MLISPFWKKFFIFAVVLLVLGWAVFLRVYDLGETSYWMDEGYSVNAALATLEHGYPLLDSGAVYDEHLPSTYAIAGSIKLFGKNEAAARAPSVIFNLLFLVVIFLFTRRFFGLWPAVLTTLFLAFSYWEIAWARQARNYALFQFLFWASIWSFWNVITIQTYEHIRIYKLHIRKFVLYSLLVLLFSFLTFLTHALGLLLIPIYLITLLVIKSPTAYPLKALRLGQTPRSGAFKGYAAGLLILFLLATILIFGGRVWSVIKGALALDINYLPNYLSFIKNNFWLVGILALFSFVLYFKNKITRQKILMLLFIYLIPLITISFFIPLSGHRYLFPALPALYILAAMTLAWPSGVRPRNALRGLTPLLLALVIILMLFFSKEFQLTPKTFYPLESDQPPHLLSYCAKRVSSANWRTKRYDKRCGGKTPIELEQKGRKFQDYYIYTPQPDWQRAYQYIKDHRTENDIIISAQPVFNKIYLGESQYWIAYPLSEKYEKPARDAYVGAKTIDNLEELKRITQQHRGFIILDFLAQDQRMQEEILAYIKDDLELVYENEVNYWSRIWIYKF